MTDNERNRLIRALLDEKRGYEIRGNKERAAQVDEQLRKLGAEGMSPAKRATKRGERG